MPKQLKELRRFVNGTKSSAADSDVQEESAIYSKNIDAISEEGKLKAVKDHIKVLNTDGRVVYRIIQPPPPSDFTAWPENWTENVESSADKFKDAAGNYYIGYDLIFKFSHRGLGTTDLVVNIPVPSFTDPGDISDAQILRNHNDQIYNNIKLSLEALARPDMEINLIRGVNGLGSEYPYPEEGVTEFNDVTGREEFIVDVDIDDDDVNDYLIGQEVPNELMPPYRSFEINFQRTFTDADNVDWDVDDISFYTTVPTNADGTETYIYDMVTIYPNTEDEVLEPGVAAEPYYPIYNRTEYLSVNAVEMEFASSEDKQNLSFYSITENDPLGPGYDEETGEGPTTYRMKVIEDFYGDKVYNDSNSTSGDPDYYDIPNQPADVTLAKKNADIYIGCGNKEGAKSKWFGKIKHKQFDNSLDKFQLQDAEVYPLDDGQTVFNLMQVAYNRHGALDAADPGITTDRAYGISDGMMDIFGIDLSGTSITNSNLGIQFKSENQLIFTPSCITPSKYAYSKNYSLDDESWMEDDDTTAIWTNHTHTANSAYWWCADKYREAVQMVKTEFDLSGVTMEASGYTLPINIVFDKPPPSGLRITDVLETYDDTAATDEKYRIWVLFSKKDHTHFSWDDEFVYSFLVSDINWGGGTVNAKAHTPPALKMKREAAWTGGAGAGRSIYVDEVTHKMDFDNFPYVCHEGTWSCRQNKLYYRLCDELGDTTDQSWSSLNARHWDRNSLAQWDFGQNCGFDKSTDYQITPHRFGLIDLEHGHRVGMMGHLKAKYIKDAGKVDTQRVSPTRNWPDRKYVIYPSRNSETIDIDETMMFFLDYEHLGVKHRRVTSGISNTSGGSPYIDESQTYALRYASYTYDADDKINMMALGLANSTAVTGYPGYNDVNKIPNNMYDIICFNKTLASTGTPTLFASVRGFVTNATTLQRYQYDYPTRSGTDCLTRKMPIGVDGVNDYTPMIFEKLGCSAFASNAPSSSTRTFFFSPRQGTYINAIGNWDASAGWVAPDEADLSSNEEGDEYIDTYLHHHEHSELEYGIVLSDGDLTGVDDDDQPILGNFNAGQTYFYKMSMLYDSYQESPMTTFYFSHVPSANCNTVVMTVKLDSPAIRATHVVIYRKNNIEDFYRLAKELDLSSGWGKVGDSNFTVKVDNGILGATYESISGMPESLRHTNVNYKISTMAGGYLFVGSCFHPEVENGQNFIFRSQPGNFSIFNWSRDFLILPNEPTAITYWAGRLYVFDEANMYKVDPNSMIMEDQHEGVGCFGEQSYIVTDFGLFFCDINNMYMHNGAKVQPIGTDVLKNAKYDETGVIRSNWHNIEHAYDPYVAYDAFNQTVMFMWEDKSGDKGSWNFNIPRNRWDLIDIPSPNAFLQGKFGERFLSDGTYLYELNKSSGSVDWTHHTPSLDFGYATVDKKIKKIKLVFNNSDDVNDAEFTMNVYSDDVLLYTVNHPLHSSGTPDNKRFKDEEHEREYKMPTNKTKKLRIELVDSNIEIDSIGITYTMRKVD